VSNSIVEVSVLSEKIYLLEDPAGHESKINKEVLESSHDIEEIGEVKFVSVQLKEILRKGEVEGALF